MNNTTNKIRFLFGFILTLPFLFSCEEKQKDIPAAFQEKNVISDVSSLKRGYPDLVEQLYTDILKKDGDLQALEDSIEKIQKTSFEKTENIRKFFENNRNYYSAAYNKTELIQDSILRVKIFNKIDENEKTFKLKTEKLTNLLSEIAQKQSELNDDYISLKILLTMKLNEEYQNNHLPDTTTLSNLKEKYENIIKQVEEKLKD